MSWSVSIPPTPADEIATAITSAELGPDNYNTPEIVAQWRQQLEAAKDAAATMLASGAFHLGEGGMYSVGMSGHAAHDGLAEKTGYTPSEFINVILRWDPS